MDRFQFKEIVQETDKAWQLCMMGGALTWFPKSKCRIEGDHVLVPKWLVEMMTKDSKSTSVTKQDVIDLMMEDIASAITLLEQGDVGATIELLKTTQHGVTSLLGDLK